ncbi:MAG: pyridoxamine 5'-phosphate oxidase family protein [Calditrichaeota bacterium]|nr:MAG: pyridoxamine 5'-phosphate oxidase family protein [Calditrichota bacterium]
MGFYSQLDESHFQFIKQQKMFFVASAPESGRINLSPKGIDTFRCLDQNSAIYLDFTGSGNETCAHILENGRLTFMFCSFDKRPNILRLYGTGSMIYPGDGAWDDLYSKFEDYAGVRQIIKMQIESVQTSCGFGVPLYEFIAERQTLEKSSQHKGEAGLVKYRFEKNRQSIDGKLIDTPATKEPPR